MIVVPCLNGISISHSEAESATIEDCAAGAQVLLNAVLEFDRGLVHRFHETRHIDAPHPEEAALFARPSRRMDAGT
jgi:hypothetical protein